MSNYSAYTDYFESLAVTNKKVQHQPTNKKQQRFFRMNIEELLSGSMRALPTDDQHPFVIFINYIRDYKKTSQVVVHDQLMFWVVSFYKKGDWDSETGARALCETVIEQFLRKIKYDSVEQTENNPWLRGMDVVNARLVPTDLRSPTGHYVGWQVSFDCVQPTTLCYNSEDWLPIPSEEIPEETPEE